MEYAEVIERGFKIDCDGKVYDDYGNEFRNEEGGLEWISREELMELKIMGAL